MMLSVKAGIATRFMTNNPAIIELGHWLQTPAGQVLTAWEQAQLDHMVADAFGYHALQIGLPRLPGLRANRMPHRWVMAGSAEEAAQLPLEPVEADPALSIAPLAHPVALLGEPEALPFPNQSLDLVLLPHTLEFAHDPHEALAEVARVLRPEGRVVLTALNRVSLWGLRQAAGHAWRGVVRSAQPLYLPSGGEYLHYRRARDWLKLLGFQIEAGRFGCHRAPLRTERGLARAAWMEDHGARWWPVLGAAYMLVGVKRVRGMRLISLARNTPRRVAAPAVVARRNPYRE